jgi:hypothetical protein
MAGEDASESWYVRARGRVAGPLSWAQLLALRERGQLARFDQVSRDRQNWVAADSVERLFPRGGPGGAFVAAGRVKDPGPRRGPEPESVGFLILDDDDAGGPGPVANSGPAASAADEATGWYYAEAGLPQGPIGFSELKRLAKDGRIGPETLYWRSGLEQWISGSALPELNRLWRSDADAGAAAGGVTLPPRGQGVGPGQTVAASRIHPLAIVSLALNLFCGVGSLAAIVVGVVALRQIARSNGTLSGKGIVLAGMLLGIAGLVISAVIAFWAFAKGGAQG